MARHIAKTLSILERAKNDADNIGRLFATEKKRISHLKDLPLSVTVKTDLSEQASALIKDAGLDADTVTDSVAVRGGNQKLGRYLKAKLRDTNDGLIQRVVSEVKSREVTVELSRSFLDILRCSDEGVATTFKSCYAPNGCYYKMPLVWAKEHRSFLALVRNDRHMVVWRALCLYIDGHLYMSKVYTDGSVRLTRQDIFRALGLEVNSSRVCPLRYLSACGYVDSDWLSTKHPLAEKAKVTDATFTRSRGRQRRRKYGDDPFFAIVMGVDFMPIKERVVRTKTGYLIKELTGTFRLFIPRTALPTRNTDRVVAYNGYSIRWIDTNTIEIEK